jgi:hypothetical protein
LYLNRVIIFERQLVPLWGKRGRWAEKAAAGGDREGGDGGNLAGTVPQI